MYRRTSIGCSTSHSTFLSNASRPDPLSFYFLIAEQSQNTANRPQKEDANIKLACVTTDVLGVCR